MTRYRQIAIAGLQLAAALYLFAPAFGAAPPPAPAVKPPASFVPPPAAEQVRPEASFTPALVVGDRVIAEDTVWRGEVLVQGVVTVAPQATLTVDPGTVVRFRRNGQQAPLVVVEGRLVAAGTKESPIVFTSAFQAPAANDWQGIMLLGSEKKNALENCRIEAAQTGLEALFATVALRNVRAVNCATGMRFQDALVAMEGGGASGCDTGLVFSQAEATLRGVNLADNRQGIAARTSSLYLLDAELSGNRGASFSCAGCRVKFQGGSVAGNGSGVTLLDCEGSVAGARIVKNREFGLSLTGSRVRVTGNQISGNGDSGVIVFDGLSVAWDNAISDNGGYDLYNAGTEEFRAPGNWWGGTSPRIFDNSGRGRVLHAPQLPAKPQPQ